MDDFKKSEVGTFEEELQALIDYGHDCCARIDDKIHECCERIKKAHDTEVGDYQIALTWMHKVTLPQYDVLDNERHKAVCKLMEMPDGYPKYSAFPFAKWYEDLSIALGINKGEFSCAKVRDTLIHLLGGDLKQAKLSDLYGIWKEEQDAMDAGRCGETSAGGGVPAADKRRADCDDNQPSEGVAPITQELRNYLEAYRPVETDTCMEVARIGTLGYQGIMERLDAIDAIHANLEREVKRLTAECKTQRNNFDQATSAREHWKNLYEQALEHTHDLERDYEVACHVNEKQEREYLEWYNRACRMQKEIDDLKAKNGDMWLKGYHECHEELMEGNATLAADLERCGWMMPPKDSDDVPVCIGDVMAYEDNTKPMEVVALVPPAVFLTEDGPRYADMCRHYHEPTVEDVLREFVSEFNRDDTELCDEEIIESFAAKLRLADDAE